MAKRSESYVVDLGQRLMQAKADCKRLQAEWDALFSPGTNPEKETSSVRRGNTTVDRIIEFLESSPGSPFDVDHIQKALGLENRNSTASTLSKLAKQKRINKSGSNRYTSFCNPIMTIDAAEAKKVGVEW